MRSPIVLALLLAGAVLLAGLGAFRIIKDPRRVSTGFILLAAIALLALWALLAVHDWDPTLALEIALAHVILLPPLSLLAAGIGLVANGVVLTRREGLRIATAVAPVAGIGLLVLPLLAYRIMDPGPETSIWQEAVVVAFLLLGLLLLVQLLAFTGYAVLYARLPRQSGTDAVVVLGCGLAGGRVTPLLASRLDRAIEVYRDEVAAGADPLLVTSGGQGPGETVAEADAMADYLEAAGLPAARIVRENRSRNTRENLRFTAALLRERGCAPEDVRMTVVTSDFHVMRTAALTRRLDLDAQVTGARTARYFVPAAFLREFIAMLSTHRRANLVVAGVLVALIAAATVYSYLPVGLVDSD
ncbi:YdcF family protein [Nocardia sp. NBC_01327]|uniref:YdcF family protein n=1 Tax=Nocardia sp. NBC_01327 TaxID=2903593 RepID=UPI002E0DC5E9|nr:YdcF family protein [Nocardia sp. NBC_01327]